MLINSSVLQTLIQQKRILGAAVLAVALIILLIWTLIPRQEKTYTTAQNELINLAENLRNHYKVRPDYWGLNTDNAVKNNLIPENMQRGKKIISSLGREIIIGQDHTGNMVMPGGRNFMLSIKNLSRTVCIAMLSWPMAPEIHPGLISIGLTTNDETIIFAWGNDLSLPISTKTAEEYCKNSNTISWTFE